MYIKEVFFVSPTGEVLTECIEDNTLRHDILVGQIIKKLDSTYEIKDSMLDNSRYACEVYNALVIMPDVNDEVILCPQTPTPAQSRYFLENFSDDLENLRVHMIRYVFEKKQYVDVKNIKMFFKSHANLEETIGKSR